MMTLHRKDPVQYWIVRFMPLRTLENARHLAQRFREVEGLRLYAQERQALVVAATLVIAFISFACAVGVVVFLADRYSLLALLGIFLLPIVLVGSFFVMAYVFFSWIEGRALARELRHCHRLPPGAPAAWLSKRFGLDMGPFPPVPWMLAVLVLFVPLTLLASVWLSAALVLIVLSVLTPLLYAKFDG